MTGAEWFESMSGRSGPPIWKVYFDNVLALNWKRDIEEGGLIPAGYGIAYFEPGRDVTVLMPIPLNMIVAVWQRVVLFFRFPPFVQRNGWVRLGAAVRAKQEAHMCAEIIFAGRAKRLQAVSYREGWEVGFRAGVEEFSKQMQRNLVALRGKEVN